MTNSLKVRRRIAHTLGLMEHEWYWEDPENGDIWCKHCKLRDYTQTKRGPCPKKKVPEAHDLRRRLDTQSKEAWDRLVKIRKLDKALAQITVSG